MPQNFQNQNDPYALLGSLVRQQVEKGMKKAAETLAQPIIQDAAQHALKGLIGVTNPMVGAAISPQANSFLSGLLPQQEAQAAQPSKQVQQEQPIQDQSTNAQRQSLLQQGNSPQSIMQTSSGYGVRQGMTQQPNFLSPQQLQQQNQLNAQMTMPQEIQYQQPQVQMGILNKLLDSVYTVPSNQLAQAQTRALDPNAPLSRAKKEEIVLQGQADIEKALATSGTSNIISQENKISDDYNKMTDDFQKRALSFQTLQDLIKAPANGANDLAIAYEYIRLQDPNAVKEGELQNLKQAVPILNRLGVKAGKLVNGKMFDDATRKQILGSATTKYNTMAKQVDILTERFNKKVRAYGGDPNRALINPGLQSSSSIPSRSQAPKGATGWDTTKNTWVY